MKVIVTGCAGFIGSHITEQLLKNGAIVVGVDNFITGSRQNIWKLKKGLNSRQKQNFFFFESDISHFGNLKGIIDSKASARTGPVTHICHQAALGSVPRSIQTPSATMRHNVHAFVNVLECARIFEIEQLVYASSSSVYGDDQSEVKKENWIGAPLSPYALSKSMDEQLAEMWSKTYNMNIVGLRYFNVFGPRQKADGPYAAVIPKWIDAIRNDMPVEIYGDGEQGRDFTYIKNVVQANMQALQTDLSGHNVFNIAAGERTSLNVLAKILHGVLGKTEIKRTYLPEREGDIKNSCADISQAKEYLDYDPEFSLELGLDDWLTSRESYQQFDDAV